MRDLVNLSKVNTDFGPYGLDAILWILMLSILNANSETLWIHKLTWIAFLSFKEIFLHSLTPSLIQNKTFTY